jgi:hypothetical protein
MLAQLFVIRRVRLDELAADAEKTPHRNWFQVSGLKVSGSWIHGAEKRFPQPATFQPANL